MPPKRNIKKYATIALIASIAMLLLSRLMFDYLYYHYTIEDKIAMIVGKACWVIAIISIYTGALSIVVLVVQLMKGVKRKW
jgi:hypothetical protein